MKISVIVPIYNAEKYLDKCLKSIVDQTYRDLEIILINDGSSDASGEICKEYASRDERIVYLEQENRGVVPTRRRGISCAQGDYVTFVDADDYLELDSFQQIVGKIDSRQADIIAFGIIEENDNSSRFSYNRIQERFYCKECLKDKIFPMMLSGESFFSFGVLPTAFSKLFKRELLERAEIEIDDSITFGEDVSLTFGLLAQAWSFQVIEHASYHYIKRMGSMTWNAQNELNLAVLEKTLTRGFERAEIMELMEKQLHEYMTFVRLLKAPRTVPGVDDFFSQKDRRVALYGAGGFGQAVHHEYRDQITLWVDRDYEKYDFLDGEVVSIDALVKKHDEYDVAYIAIINEKLCGQIKEELTQKGINKEIRYFKMYPSNDEQ